jgi:hypothetical protein
MILLAKWIESRGLDDRVAYIFETGHRFKGEADSLMGMAGSHPALAKQARCESYAFVNKSDPVSASSRRSLCMGTSQIHG